MDTMTIEDYMVGQVLHTQVREMTIVHIWSRAKCSIIEAVLQLD